jgi:glycine/D-amino acid oxidase-like deaminating enzyme
MTSHDFLSCWTSLYSIDFYEKLGHYERIGGLEVARVGDDTRMDEIKRKVSSGKAFGTRARLIEPAEIKEKFPLIEESMVQGGLWDPDAGLVIPRSQTVAGKLVDAGREAPASCRLSPTRRPSRWSSRTAASRASSPSAARSWPTMSWSAPAYGAG